MLGSKLNSRKIKEQYVNVVYKVLDLKRNSITLVKHLTDRYELIEELEVPDGEDVDDFLQNELESVDLGDMCERRTRY